MRLQFWRDALPAIHAGDASKHRHPVAVALSRVLPAGGARAKRWLNSIVDARMKDAASDGAPPLGIAYLEAYAHDTNGSLLYAIMDLAGGVRDAETDHACAHLGKAIGVANLLRGTHAHSKQRRRCVLYTGPHTTAFAW